MKKEKVKETQLVSWFFRGVTDDAHRAIGKTLGVGGDVSDDVRLQERLPCVDGKWSMWDCEGIPFEHLKAILISGRMAGYQIYLYQKVGDGLPERWQEDDEVREALGEIPKKKTAKKAGKAKRAVVKKVNKAKKAKRAKKSAAKKAKKNSKKAGR